VDEQIPNPVIWLTRLSTEPHSLRADWKVLCQKLAAVDRKMSWVVLKRKVKRWRLLKDRRRIGFRGWNDSRVEDREGGRREDRGVGRSIFLDEAECIFDWDEEEQEEDKEVQE
jgi:hypothetical protein